MGDECINIKLVLIVFFKRFIQVDNYNNKIEIISVYLNNAVFKMRLNTFSCCFKMYLLSPIF
jgi:hypothetical protein